MFQKTRNVYILQLSAVKIMNVLSPPENITIQYNTCNTYSINSLYFTRNFYSQLLHKSIVYAPTSFDYVL